MKNLVILILLVFVTILSATDMIIESNDGIIDYVPINMIENITFEQYDEVVAEGITLQWRTDDEYLYVNIMAPTTGWVAVGFDPTNAMQDANIIIGYVDGSGEVFIRDDFGTSPGSHASDESLGGDYNVMDHYGKEEEGITMLHFKIPLDSGDECDRPLIPGINYDIILAYGSADNYTGFHSMATSLDIDL
jgi:DOMON domain-containing protein